MRNEINTCVRWHEGDLPLRRFAGFPKPSFWTGTKINDKEKHPIQSYRCTHCGYLESHTTGA